VDRMLSKRAASAAAAVGLTVVLAGAGVTGTALAAGPGAVSYPGSHPASRAAVVVRERTTRHFGKVLFTNRTLALYYLPSGSCSGTCLSVWPPLLMPSGKTKPKGASCLGTAKYGTHHRLQVTYRGRRLYTFVSDTRGSINGNGLEGFKVAKVAARC
jgi:predicted lipoprotein with Yx(FWY)xxD motif